VGKLRAVKRVAFEGAFSMRKQSGLYCSVPFCQSAENFVEPCFEPVRVPEGLFPSAAVLVKLVPEADGWGVRAGVVFNEMKGVYSQPDSMLARYTQQALFPDNTYGVDSGGDPSVIPDLTFAEFQDFHRKFYHPSNARIWFYGDDPLDKRLEILDSETPHPRG
jgi:hypothetical protein